jgi:hypothetical protein
MNKRIGRAFGIGAALMVACATAVGVAGCAADSGSPSSSTSIKDGLTVLKSDATGVSMAYKANGRIVYLQTSVGQLKPLPYRKSFPHDPQSEMDGRLVDQEGRTFGLLIGGDRLIDPSWAADLTGAGDITTKAEGVQRAADFLLAREAAAAFAAQAGPELADHVFHLTNMTAKTPDEDTGLQKLAKEIESTNVDRDYATTTYAQEGVLYTIPLGNGSGGDELGAIAGDIADVLTGAEHSSVQSWQYNSSSGSWSVYVSSCNHGPCAGSSGMSFACYSCSGYAGPNPASCALTTNTLQAYWGYESNSSLSIGGACTSSNYGIDILDINVYGADDPNHVCNDDSAMELQEIRNIARLAGNWSGGSGGWNNGFACSHNTTFFGQWESDIQPPACP